MFVAFFESIRYVGHLWPVAFLRVFTGYYYLNQALSKINGEFLNQPKLAEQISQWLPTSHAPHLYQDVLDQVVVPYWNIFAHLIAGTELVIAISLLLGYLVRPLSVVAIFVCINYLWVSAPELSTFYKTLIAVHITLGWIGAGRCLGIDYYFYKRMRGIWW